MQGVAAGQSVELFFEALFVLFYVADDRLSDGICLRSAQEARCVIRAEFVFLDDNPLEETPPRIIGEVIQGFLSIWMSYKGTGH